MCASIAQWHGCHSWIKVEFSFRMPLSLDAVFCWLSILLSAVSWKKNESMINYMTVSPQNIYKLAHILPQMAKARVVWEMFSVICHSLNCKYTRWFLILLFFVFCSDYCNKEMFFGSKHQFIFETALFGAITGIFLLVNGLLFTAEWCCVKIRCDISSYLSKEEISTCPFSHLSVLYLSLPSTPTITVKSPTYNNLITGCLS